MIERFPYAGYRRSVWRNGKGTSWEIVAEPRTATGTADAFEWRFALADLAGDAPFSAYPGIERTITLIEGRGFDLAVAGRQELHIREIGRPETFPGDAATTCRLADGPARVLNLMVLRECWRSRIAILQAAAEPQDLPGAEALFIFTLAGAVTLHGSGKVLARWDSVLITGADAGWPGRLRVPAGALAYVATLDPH